MNHLLKIKLCEIRIFEAHHEISELQRYFESDLTRKMFINDIVFLEEKKNKFNKELVLKELPEDAFLVLPLFNRARSSNTGIVILGVKPFGDSYSSKEIEVIAGFLLNLEIHIKYIHTYEQINELTINLDKKVDEKTIEYNNLINQQKEFIGLISHEIKSPIANAIFQADSLLDDIEAETISRDEISEQLRTLNTQLIHVGDLTSKLFSVQYFDIHAVSLFKEKVQIGYMLQTEFDVYSRVNKHIQFINQISNTIGFISVDRIQFQQVIANILGNAIKFLDKKNSVIIVEAFTEK